MENQLLDSDMLSKDGKSLSSLIENGYETHSVDYIKKGFAIFRQDMGSFLGFIIIVAIMQIVMSMIPVVKGIMGPLLAPIIAGVFLVSKRIDKNEPYEFSTFFDGTKMYKELFTVALIPTVLTLLIFLIFAGWGYFKMMVFSSKFIANPGMGFGIAAILVLIISILFMLGTFLVLFERMEPIRALDVSRKIVSKKFFNWLGFLLLLGLFNFAGLLCLVIGLLVTIPSTVCALYVAYEDVVGLNLRD